MLAGMIHRFVYLKIGLAVVLVYVGFKMLVSTVYKIPIWASLTFIAVSITVSIIASLRSTRGAQAEALAEAHPEALGGSGVETVEVPGGDDPQESR
jgi:tellurite resistance protein TerC